MRRQILALFAFLAPLPLIACGSSGTGTGGAGGETSTTSTSTTSTTTSSTTTSSTTSSSTTTSSTTSSSTTSTGPVDQCTNAADGALVSTNDMQKVGGDCALANIDFATGMLKEPGLTDCIKSLNGSDAGTLSDGCAGCFSAVVHCAAETCGTSCNPLKGGSPMSQACTDCRMAMCDPAFKACSGLP